MELCKCDLFFLVYAKVTFILVGYKCCSKLTSIMYVRQDIYSQIIPWTITGTF